MSSARAHAKVNLALVVGPLRVDGKHEVVTVLQELELHDTLHLESADELRVEGFEEDTIVRSSLLALADLTRTDPCWRVVIEKRIPVAAGLGGGSSDAATALRLANATLPEPLDPQALIGLAARSGADVPFFLDGGTQLGTGDGGTLAPLDLPHDYAVLLALPSNLAKESTAAVYAAFDRRDGAAGFDERRRHLLADLETVHTAAALGRLPPNDLADVELTGPDLAHRLRTEGAFRADVSGAGPCVYGLFASIVEAQTAAASVAAAARTWVTVPVATTRPRACERALP